MTIEKNNTEKQRAARKIVCPREKSRECKVIDKINNFSNLSKCRFSDEIISSFQSGSVYDCSVTKTDCYFSGKSVPEILQLQEEIMKNEDR